MGETRVNLKHQLENLRDSYLCPIEEAIITELIANALDSRASHIAFTSDELKRELRVVDNGQGMSEESLVSYHDLAATHKLRGEGIGFAGQGAKLALLIADAVVTETRRLHVHKATRWHLDTAYRAPWNEVNPPGWVENRGTAVCLCLREQESPLLDAAYIEQAIQRHFSPLLDQQFDRVLRTIYQAGVRLTVNGKPVATGNDHALGAPKYFFIKLGKRGQPVGIGYLAKAAEELDEAQQGVAVSTFGKVIKRGWEWLGLNPRHPRRLTGIVEVPAMADLLTANKADFLRDATSLQKYYRYRKAIQEALGPILRELGEEGSEQERTEESLRPLERELERVLADVVPSFPELAPLLGARGRKETIGGVLPDPQADPVGVLQQGVDVMTGTEGGGGEGGGVEAAPGVLPGQRIALAPEPTELGRPYEGRRKRPGLMMKFEDEPDRMELGWLIGNTVSINAGHPAYHRAKRLGADPYHIMLTVSCVLSAHVQSGKSPQEFMNHFLSVWGSGK